MRIEPVPLRDDVVDPPMTGKSSKLSRVWERWMAWLEQAMRDVDRTVGRVKTRSEGAAITTTAVPTPVLATGLYVVRYAIRVARAATSSSSLTVTVGWTDGGVACSQAGAALTGNTTATQQNGAPVVRVDAGTTITYAVAYASVGATSCLYDLDVAVTEVA